MTVILKNTIMQYFLLSRTEDFESVRVGLIILNMTFQYFPIILRTDQIGSLQIGSLHARMEPRIKVMNYHSREGLIPQSLGAVYWAKIQSQFLTYLTGFY